MKLRQCSKCECTKPPAAFHSNGPGILRSACKECEADRDKVRRPSKPRPPAKPKPPRTPRPPKLTPEERRERRIRRLDRERERLRAKRAALPKVGRFGPEPELLVFDGLALSRAQWAKRLGLAGATSIHSRFDRGEWGTPRALTQHVIFKNQRHADREASRSKHDALTHDGRMQSVEAWALELVEPLGLSIPAIVGRLRLGWSVDRALSTPVRPHLPKGAQVKPVSPAPPEFVGPKRPVGRPRK